MTKKKNNEKDPIALAVEALQAIKSMSCCSVNFLEAERKAFLKDCAAVEKFLRQLQADCIVIEQKDVPEDLREVIERVEDSCQSYGARAYYMPEDIGALISAALLATKAKG